VNPEHGSSHDCGTCEERIIEGSSPGARPASLTEVSEYEGQPTVLLIGDDPELCSALSVHLVHGGFRVEIARARDWLRAAQAEAYALVALGLLNAGGQAFDALRQLRAVTEAPVIMLLGRDEEADRILALEQGADDCLSWPFGLREILARIRALLRRPGGGMIRRAPPADELVRVGDLVLDPRRRIACRGGRIVDLTSREFDLLEVLLRNAGTVVRRERLGGAPTGSTPALERSLDVRISRLRKKLGPSASNGERIKTIRNIGYQYLSGRQAGGEEHACAARPPASPS
jgi:two-component system, OmpR family, response regulator CpxR